MAKLSDLDLGHGEESVPPVPSGNPQTLSRPAPVSNPDPSAVTVEDVLGHLPLAFLSGRAGTGKTTLARQIAESLGDRAVLCATTGIAAVNLGNATTINALLHYFDTTNLEKHLNSGYLRLRLDRLRQSGLRVIILDETSMLSAPQFGMLVAGLDELASTQGYDRELYHYGDEDDLTLKLLLVGDFAQLPPVEAPYAFQAPEWERLKDHTIRLEKVWRQDNAAFVNALHAVRLGKPSEAVTTLLPCFHSTIDFHFEGTTIVSKNADVDYINEKRHRALPGEPITWEAQRSGEQLKDWITHIPNSVSLKPGALVMCLMNRPYPKLEDEIVSDYYYVNGDLATVVEKFEDGIQVLIHRTQQLVTVLPVVKENTEPVTPPQVVDKDYQAKPGETVVRVTTDDGTSQRVITKRLKGMVCYMPLRLAYATTVHKSQGLTLDKVQVAIADRMFTHPSMLYVALSRCRTLEGLRIVGSPRLFMGRCSVDKKVRPFL